MATLDELSLQLSANRARGSLVDDALIAFAEPDPMLRPCRFAEILSGKWATPTSRTGCFKAPFGAMPDLAERHLAATGDHSACDRLALYRMVKGTTSALTIANWLDPPPRS